LRKSGMLILMQNSLNGTKGSLQDYCDLLNTTENKLLYLGIGSMKMNLQIQILR